MHHPTAVISPHAQIEPHVYIGPGAVINAKVCIKSHSFIGPNVIIGEPTLDYYQNPSSFDPPPTLIGSHSILRTGTIIYSGVTIGSHFQTGPYAVVRERTTFGTHCSIGNNCDVQADVTVGDYTRCHSNVTLGQYSKVGSYCWLMPYVILMNDFYPPNYLEPRGAVIGDFTVLGARTVVFPVTLGRHVVSASQTQITQNFPDFSLVRGIPAEQVGDCRNLIATDNEGRRYRPYPWPRHRNQGYPFTEELLRSLECEQ